MSGGLAQLVAIGAQDAHIVGKPEVSFFQSAYKRHTNFSQVVDRQLMQGTPVANGMTTVRFERKGDLLNYVYIAATDGSDLGAFSSPTWSDVIDHVELYIGGQLIDMQTYEFSSIAISAMAQNLSKTTSLSRFYPLRFFFCENWQSSLPLVALQYHDVEIRFYWGSNLGGNSYDVYANFIYLDTMEREALTKGGFDMLITQVQRMPKSGGKNQELTFNHPVKYLLSKNTDTWTTTAGSKTRLQINGVDVAAEKPVMHFIYPTNYYHTSYNTTNQFLYPFCLETAKLQPTGQLNFSRLDSARIISDNNITTDIYAVNYNILRIENGMGGLRYSN
jgi:hypothetical protein